MRFRAGDLDGAVEPLERAVDLNRQFARAQRLLGLVYHALGRHDAALRALRRGLARGSEAPQATLAESQLLYELGDVSGCEDALRRALAVSPDWPDLHLALARTLRAQDQLEHAAAAYERALELKPDYDAAALERAALALEMARPDVAAAKLAPLAASRPRWADVHALLGRARLRLGDAAAAEGSLRAAPRPSRSPWRAAAGRARSGSDARPRPTRKFEAGARAGPAHAAAARGPGLARDGAAHTRGLNRGVST